MMPHKILMSNLGYARGIDGSLVHHLKFVHRHVYCSPLVQQKALRELSQVVLREDPDICCFVEIDQGSFDSCNTNQLELLLSEKYAFSDIDSKYGLASPLRSFPLTRGKSNAFISKRKLAYEKMYFTHGTKKLIYKIHLENHVTLFFAHFSLKHKVRAMQLRQTADLIAHTPGEVAFMGDFNILTGFQELQPIIESHDLLLLNKEDTPTFRFHRREIVLDVCLCSRGLAERADLRVIPQSYSDHDALLLTINP